ncbi:MAG: 30S ribosomal protein S20 [Phycisphaerales bacterium]|nr:MAG: 30S ribosomal protein S20 [Phycisphaerales bacterium]
MPNTESAKKRVRQTVKRNALNQWRKRRIKEQVKLFLKAVQDQDVKAAEAEYRKTCGILDKVACTSTMHRNTAARRKSRLSRRLVEMKRKAAPA